jgi:phosphosulfolactate phosphohydrolase-like enzyme
VGKMITLNPTNEMQLLMKAADIGQVVANTTVNGDAIANAIEKAFLKMIELAKKSN